MVELLVVMPPRVELVVVVAPMVVTRNATDEQMVAALHTAAATLQDHN